MPHCHMAASRRFVARKASKSGSNMETDVVSQFLLSLNVFSQARRDVHVCMQDADDANVP